LSSGLVDGRSLTRIMEMMRPILAHSKRQQLSTLLGAKCQQRTPMRQRFSTLSHGPNRLRLTVGAGCIPKAANTAGEDAFFASHPLSAFALADGVGGWSTRGVDAGLFSRALIRHTFSELTSRTEGMQRPDLGSSVRNAYENVRKEQWRGSSTLLVGQLHLDMLSILNLGDCGIMMLRPMEVLPRFHGGTVRTALRRVYRSTPMLHRPNMPLQLSSDDLNGSAINPFDLVSVRLQCGDLIIAGTDGLFDNVGDRELEHIVLNNVKNHSSGSAGVTELAEAVLSRAAEAARAPMEMTGGGKLDDIAVVVAQAEKWVPTVKSGLLNNAHIGESDISRT